MTSAHPKSSLRVFRREEHQHSSDDDLDLDDDVPTQSNAPHHPSTSSFDPNVFIPYIDAELIRKIMIKRGSDKAPGVSGLTNDSLLRALRYSDFADNLALLFRKLLSKEFIPQSWLISRLVPIPKGENSYRPISMTTTVAQVQFSLFTASLMLNFSAWIACHRAPDQQRLGLGRFLHPPPRYRPPDAKQIDLRDHSPAAFSPTHVSAVMSAAKLAANLSAAELFGVTLTDWIIGP